jgi:hypothetical protein
MREANWDEIFHRPSEAKAEAKREPGFLPWEDWLTFGILAVMFLSVVHSIDSANWVDDMPSLYPIGFAGLLMGYGLSRVKWNELLLHPPALLVGAALVYLQLIAIVPGGSLLDRTYELVDRMHVWWTAVTQDGISTDPLPFIVLMLPLVWLGAYVSSWAVFRWRNAWIGLVPGGVALMWNISFIPGQYSNSFIVFVFAAVLLLMRVHLSHKEAEWDRAGVTYPEFISLPVLNATFWVAVALLLFASWLPLAQRSETASERWSNFTAPLTERFTPLARVFISVNAKKPISVHNLDDALPLQGQIKLNGREAVELDVEITPEMAAFLRSQSFDEYTASGWKVNVEGEQPLAAGERPATSTQPEEQAGRQDVTINVTVKGNGDENIFTLGQPISADTETDARIAAGGDDVTGLKPDGRLHEGDTYTSTGSVAVASIEQLENAGSDYPDWVRERYLALPGSVPDRVYAKAEEVVADAQTPYEQAVAIERYLRSFPNDFNVAATPPGRDSVDYFLFDMQRGYFDYHASAMAVMLRSLGVPARVATGYAIDPLSREDPETNRYKLTERNAFAWPEVYFPGIGWVEFSPTPTQPLIRRPGFTEATPRQGGTRGLEDPANGNDDLGFAELDPSQELTPADASASAADGGGGGRSWPVMLTLIVIGGIAATAALGTRFAWEFGLAGLPRPVQLWEKTQRLARFARTPARTSDTPREFASRLRDSVPGTDGATYMASQYERARFGQKDLSEEESERLETAWSSVRNQLLRRIFRPKRQ